MYGEFFNFCVSIKDVHYYVTSLGNGKWILYYKCHYYPLECVSFILRPRGAGSRRVG
jgi:hypothetical protein